MSDSDFQSAIQLMPKPKAAEAGDGFYCLQCCTAYPTQQTFRNHGIGATHTHACTCREECEEQLAKFRENYPNGKVV